MLLLPNFQRTFQLLSLPHFLNGSAKVADLFILANFSSDLIPKKRFRQPKIYCLIFEELTTFFQAGCKYMMSVQLNPNNYRKDIHTYLLH
jgi:hypothetical protein